MVRREEKIANSESLDWNTNEAKEHKNFFNEILIFDSVIKNKIFAVGSFCLCCAAK